eukprot:Blabericola_migrator_1__12373@NODE_776_length_6565_cov_52_387504_g552_i0_p1_GENE_NODE_776_length_6565_cov_52_387504_g552_i0NODE_776_length_6565_cov_52_387504_g552_i0_p1_ORF_typecomplete_len442_score46_63Nucleoside_tran/PF01733_18/2_2e03Nucleoside_tran/PF01733_18/1_8e41DUF5527/PF17665_1/1e03DUF5527/PF17665_1/3_9e03DUF5527/PF17665_1/0_058Trp_oprn_chp/PF09534_10/5_2e03Trp_oprn_chp/PF09534_10/4_9e02Trp_oprn_chp/PF09534_10/0_05Trp_oprn_chp/PF09534_10/5_4e03VirB8/PF04335_13/0_16Ferlin_C/PF16165_5/8_3e
MPPSAQSSTSSMLPIIEAKTAKSVFSKDDSRSASLLARSQANDSSPNTDIEASPGPEGTQQETHFSWALLFIFLLIGTSHLMFWNSILNILSDIRLNYFTSIPSASDTLTAAQTLGTVIAAIANSIYGKLSLRIFLITACVQAAAHLLTPAVLYAESEVARAGLLHVLYFLAGLANGGMQSFGYALSGAMPYVYTGAVSAGNGLSGLITFAVWMIVQHVGNPTVMRNLWALMIVGFVIVVASIIIVLVLYKRPEVKGKIDADNAAMAVSKNDPSAPSYFELLKHGWPMVLSVFAVFYCTLAFFPNVGPIRWSSTGSKLDTVLGMFQVGDFGGRFLPNMAFFVVSRTTVYISVALRYIFIVFFVSFWKMADSTPWNSFAFQIVIMLLFAITNGWASSNAMIHAPGMIEHESYRGKMASVALVGLLLGINLGSWTSRLIVLGN